MRAAQSLGSSPGLPDWLPTSDLPLLGVFGAGLAVDDVNMCGWQRETYRRFNGLSGVTFAGVTNWVSQSELCNGLLPCELGRSRLKSS